MTKLSEGEKKVIQGLEQLGGKGFTKRIAGAADICTQTASKYLSILEAKNIVNKDDSELPHIHWELIEDWDAKK